MKHLNMRGIKMVYMISVREGEGTPEDVSRIVQYFYDDECDTLIGKIDPADMTPTGHDPSAPCPHCKREPRFLKVEDNEEVYECPCRLTGYRQPIV